MTDEQNIFRNMTFWDHLRELRVRLIKASIFTGFIVLICVCFQNAWVDIVLKPHFWAMDYLRANGITVKNPNLVALKYTEKVIVYFKIAIYAGLILSAPYILCQLWGFISPALKEKEKNTIVYYACASFGLFLTGVLFGYFFAIPYTLQFLAGFQVDIIDNFFGFSEYVSLFFLLTIIMGAAFELPLIMLALSKLGLVSPKTYSSKRRHAIVIILIVAAVLTPPDPISMIFMAVPMLVLYEIGIILAKIVYKG
ncbi:MAG: twin-arginine translocase subunit TatC [Planctomycetes bacterium]|nr:twin-arginine translocase subunit TatC [Planctomycetota bacterium]